MAIPFFETGDPARLWPRRIGFDRALLILIFIVMFDRLTENPLHEALGTVAGAAVVFHMALNRRWYERRLGIWPRAVAADAAGAAGTARARGRKSRPMRAADRLQFAVNVLLTLAFAASFISGVMCSQTLFAGVTPEAWRMDLAYRTAHVALSMWFFLAAALHAGIHAYVLAGPRISSAFSRLGVRLAAGFLLILMAVRLFFIARVRELDLLFGFESAYIPVERGEWALGMPLDLLILFALAAAVGFAALKALDRINA